MPKRLKAVIFDVDGVLIDSLTKHLEFCMVEAANLSLNLDIPSADGFRRMVQSGARVSPMADFFRAVGFPENQITRAVADYDANFATSNTPSIFDGVTKLLQSLHDAGIKLGFVTSNIQPNVDPILGSLINLIDPACRFYLEPGQTKATQIAQGAIALGIDTAECVFVGDQPTDEAAAGDAGVQFVGVTYGWGFSSSVTHCFKTADSPFGIPLAAQQAILGREESDIQLDYAWKWFNYHASQRIQMFNYMLVGLGLFATAIVSALDKRLPDFVPFSLCLSAGVIALIFSLIDERNQHLLGLGEDVLAEHEQSQIFGRDKWIIDRQGEKIPFGILWRQHRTDPRHGKFCSFIFDAWQGKHRIWLRTIALILASLFLASSFLIARYGLPDQPGKETTCLLRRN